LHGRCPRPSFETHRSRDALSMNTLFMVRVQRRFRSWGLRMRFGRGGPYDPNLKIAEPVLKRASYQDGTERLGLVGRHQLKIVRVCFVAPAAVVVQICTGVLGTQDVAEFGARRGEFAE
jgi:hypothetical protein